MDDRISCHWDDEEEKSTTCKLGAVNLRVATSNAKGGGENPFGSITSTVILTEPSCVLRFVDIGISQTLDSPAGIDGRSTDAGMLNPEV